MQLPYPACQTNKIQHKLYLENKIRRTRNTLTIFVRVVSRWKNDRDEGFLAA